MLNANEIVEPNEFDEANEDITLAQMFPRNLNSTNNIKKNWDCFGRAYDNLEFENTTVIITFN